MRYHVTRRLGCLFSINISTVLGPVVHDKRMSLVGDSLHILKWFSPPRKPIFGLNHILFITRHDKRIGQSKKLCLALSIGLAPITLVCLYYSYISE